MARHLRLREAEAAKPAEVPAGTDVSKPAIPPAGMVGRRSTCAGFDQALREGIAMGLTAQRIFQDLRTDHGFIGADDIRMDEAAGKCRSDGKHGVLGARFFWTTPCGGGQP